MKKDLIDDSPFFPNKKEKKGMTTDLKNNNSYLTLGSDFLNIDEENKDNIPNENSNSIFPSLSSEEEDNFNFYNVAKTNLINYMTPIKVNNYKNKKENNNNKTNKEISEELFSVSNNSAEGKKIMISELDIDLPDELNNSKNDFSTNYKKDKNNEIITKKIKKDFKKEIEQNLKKFLKSNQENEKETKNDKNNLKMNVRLNKHSDNIKYCFTDLSQKINILKKNIISNKESMKKNPNKLTTIISIRNKNDKTNNSFKTKTQNVITSSRNKKLNAFVKINLKEKIKKNNEKKDEHKNKIFFLKNSKFNNNKILKPNEFNNYVISQIKNNTNGYNSYSNQRIRNDFINISEKKRIIDKQNKINYNTASNIKEKNIIIQNFNCIDYNNINISINNNNNIINQFKLTHRRNIDKNKLLFNNKKFNTINTQKLKKIEKEDKKENFYKSYIRNFYKNNHKIINEKKGNFQRINNDKKLTFIENNLGIKKKILNYYLNQKRNNQQLNTKNKKENELKFKKNDFELKKYFNTIDVNVSKNNFKSDKKTKII